VYYGANLRFYSIVPLFLCSIVLLFHCSSVISFRISPVRLFGISPAPLAGGWKVDISSLPPGIYLAVVREGTSIVGSGKFVVVK
jgi:hypothetical protein